MSCQEPSPRYISVGELAWELRVWLLSSCSCLEHPLPTSPDSHLPVICIIRKLQYFLGHTADFCCFIAAPQIRTPRSREIDWGIYTPWKLQSSCPHICLSCFSVWCCIFIENGGGNADSLKCWDASFSSGRWHRKCIAFISFGSGASYFLRGIFSSSFKPCLKTRSLSDLLHPCKTHCISYSGCSLILIKLNFYWPA